MIKINLRELFKSVTIQNAASSYIAFVWLSLFSIICIPVYIKLLGVEEWGLVAACTSLQVLSNLVDAGFSQILPRLAAQESQNPSRLKQLIIVLRRLYVSLALLIFLILQIFSNFLAYHWFQVSSDVASELTLSIRLISFQFLFQFINNFHIGIWNGLEQQVLANVRTCLFGSIKHVTAMTVLFVFSPKAWIYALTFAIVALLEVIFNAVLIQKKFIQKEIGMPRKKLELNLLLQEVALLSGGIVVGLLVSQVDRIVLSSSVSVASFGIYTVISTLAFAFLQIQTPVTRALFPVIVKDIQNLGVVRSKTIKKLFAGTFLAATLPSFIGCLLAPQILILWLHNEEIANSGATTLRMLLIAIALNSIYGCIYQLIVALSRSKLVLKYNLFSLIVVGVVFFIVPATEGIKLGGYIWLAITTTQLFFGINWFVKNIDLFNK